MLARAKLDQATLKEHLFYDEETGLFVRITAGKGFFKGDVAGSIALTGYRIIHLQGRVYQASRLAWLYMYGYTPALTIDHINGNRADDRICNLRLATQSEQNCNTKTRMDNKSGRKGVCYEQSRANAGKAPWVASVEFEGKRIRKCFKTKDEAVDARTLLEQQYHGSFIRHEVFTMNNLSLEVC